MPTRLIGLLAGGLLLCTAGPALAAEAFDVKIRVEGKSKTLVKERKVTLADAPIIKDGNTEHSCGGQSALGALQQGTGGNWSGKWYDGLGYSADTIMGNTPAAPGYFELWVNHKLSSTGLCDTALAEGAGVLMFVQDCTFDAKLGKCPNPVTPLGLRIPTQIKKGKTRTLTVLDYDASGKATPESGATIYFNGKRQFKSDKNGQVKFKAQSTGTAQVYATKKGHVRTESVAVRVKA